MARKKETLWSEQAHDTPAGHQAVPPEPLSVNPRRSAVILFSPRPASPASPRPPRTCESLPPSSPSPSHYHSPDSGTSSRRIPIVQPGPTSLSPDSVFFPPAPSIPIVLSSTPD